MMFFRSSANRLLAGGSRTLSASRLARKRASFSPPLGGQVRRPKSTAAAMVEGADWDKHEEEKNDNNYDDNGDATAIINSIKFSAALPSVAYLYDDHGSDLFEEITRLEEYYLTRTELAILQKNANEMVRFVDENAANDDDESFATPRTFHSSLIELGAGSGQKLHPLLDAKEKIPKSLSSSSPQEGATMCTYLPADYSSSALDMNVGVYNANRRDVQPYHGTHESALAALHVRRGRKTWAYLGSSLGNDVDPVPFLKNLAAHCVPRDRVLLGIDLAAHPDRKPVKMITAAYNDSKGITSQFILNALEVVNRVAGLDFDLSKFKLHAEYNVDTDAVEMFAECTVKCDITTAGGELVRSLQVGDRIFIEQSGKFSESKIEQMIHHAGLVQQRRWTDDNNLFSILELVPDLPGRATDLSEFIFMNLIGEERLAEQPVLLRNPFAFYWGHISAFSDRVALGLPGRDHEREVFERGVDPDVDDPTQIHRHSPRFQVWPSASEFQKYAAQVNTSLREKIASSGVTRDVLMALEHAEMHHETLMYMVLQMSDNDKRPEAVHGASSYRHPFAEFAIPSTTTTTATPSHDGSVPLRGATMVPIGPTPVTLGASKADVSAAGLVWDNEHPSHTAGVDAFHCSVCPVTNAEFSNFVQDGGYKHQEFWEDNEVHAKVVANGGAGAWDWIQREKIERPLFWEDNGTIRSLNKITSFPDAADWPAIVSLFEAAAYCRWLGNSSRIMTEREYHALFDDQEDFNNAAGLGNNNWRFQGVVPVGTMNDASAKGVYDLVGNGWEWTSTVFAGFEGFEPMHDYMEYSADFFDGKHFVLKGASPYTGKLVQRMSFRNWYQANYPYPIAKFRVVK